MLKSLTISLFLTIVIELTASLVLGIRNKEDIYVVILVNICTNPIVVFIANCLILIGSNKLIYNIIVIIMKNKFNMFFGICYSITKRSNKICS